MYKFSILITTKNRLEDLKFTLQKINYLFERNDVECIICDDGSTDATFEYIKQKYPRISIIQNNESKGLIYSRNRLMSLTTSEFAISLDDDLNFLTQNPLEIIESFFKNNHKCAVISFRIFWNIAPPKSTITTESSLQMRGFAGGAHAFRMSAWKTIPNYPDWFVFYGEEDFAAFQLFKNNWDVYYVPDILVHHRVDIKARKKDNDYQIRLRRSLRSGWYLYFMFYPWKLIPKRFLYTLWIQFKNKVFKGDFKAFLAIMQALGDVIITMPRLIKNANRLSKKEFLAYSKLPETKLYWTPKDKQTQNIDV